MHAFITRRFLLLIFVLFGVSVLIFGILMTFSPERRAAAFVTTPQQAKDIPKLIIQFGLDDPFYIQYFRWIKKVGRDQPTIAKIRVKWSIQLSRWTPEIVPSQIPKIMTMGAASRFISRVTGK